VVNVTNVTATASNGPAGEVKKITRLLENGRLLNAYFFICAHSD